MLLPSGPANTRCLVCRFDPGGLHVQLSLAPGTGLQSPETGSQNRRYRDLSRQQRPHVPHLNPRKCPQIAGYSSETGKHRFASDCVVGPRGCCIDQRVRRPRWCVDRLSSGPNQFALIDRRFRDADVAAVHAGMRVCQHRESIALQSPGVNHEASDHTSRRVATFASCIWTW
jgi:hypothetical protein